jgi:hypothetical protein
MIQNVYSVIQTVAGASPGTVESRGIIERFVEQEKDRAAFRKGIRVSC